jgi:membrane-associated protease RseP (regulator of RpoE activity)
MIDHTLNKAVSGNYEFLVKRLDALDPTQRWQVTVKPFKTTRSTEQNSRLWKLYTELGQYIGHSPDEVHQLMGYKFLRELKTVNSEPVEVIKSTTKLNTKDMTTYMEAIEQWAAEIGYVWEDK